MRVIRWFMVMTWGVATAATLSCGSMPASSEVPPTVPPSAEPRLNPPAVSPLVNRPTNPPLIRSQKDSAVALVRDSGVVESINGGQEWEPGRISRTDLAGALAVSVEAVWRKPVESSGPWHVIHCKGTRRSVISESWSQITRLEVILDQEYPSDVAGYMVVKGSGEGSAVLDVSEPPMPPKIYDVENGEVLWRSTSGAFPTADEVCPPGTSERNLREYR